MSCGLQNRPAMLEAGPICCPPINTLRATICADSCGKGCCSTTSPSGCGPSCLGQGERWDACCGPKKRREKRWKPCNFLKPCIDTRIYRNGEALCISYAGHIPGEQYIHGRNLPTTTTFAKRRLCQYTPYEFIDPDGCCSFCNYP